jgi:hypothetical protein
MDGMILLSLRRKPGVKNVFLGISSESNAGRC